MGRGCLASPPISTPTDTDHGQIQVLREYRHGRRGVNMGMEREKQPQGQAGGGRGVPSPPQVTLIAVISLQPTSLKERGWAEGGDGAKESKHIII